ncbi:MAG: hypothetical protein WC604_02465, partial [Candidatus Gracilibacteria bacterium]
MEIRIKKVPGQPTIFAKISYILGGILMSTSILSLGINLLHTYGIGIGFLICLALSYFGFVKTKTSPRLRLVIWGIAGTTAFYVVAATAFYYK